MRGRARPGGRRCLCDPDLHQDARAASRPPRWWSAAGRTDVGVGRGRAGGRAGDPSDRGSETEKEAARYTGCVDRREREREGGGEEGALQSVLRQGRRGRPRAHDVHGQISTPRPRPRPLQPPAPSLRPAAQLLVCILPRWREDTSRSGEPNRAAAGCSRASRRVATPVEAGPGSVRGSLACQHSEVVVCCILLNSLTCIWRCRFPLQ